MLRAKGVSRNGAGRPAYKIKGEQLMRLDIRPMSLSGLLWVGSTNSWSRGDELVGSVQLTVNIDSIRLAYSFNGQDASQNVTIMTTTTACGFGGSRRWFGCACLPRARSAALHAFGTLWLPSMSPVSYSTQSGSECTRGFALYHRLMH